MPRPKSNDYGGFYVGFGKRLRRAREERGLTQEALAGMVPLTRSSIANIERGKQKPMLHTVAEIAAALDVGIADLVPEIVEAAPAAIERALEARPQDERRWVQSIVAREARSGR